jgi:hypothetical protein
MTTCVAHVYLPDPTVSLRPLFLVPVSAGYLSPADDSLDGKLDLNAHLRCLAASKGACENRLLVRRTVAERIIVAAVRDRLTSSENLQYLLKRAEEEMGKLYAVYQRLSGSSRPSSKLRSVG